MPLDLRFIADAPLRAGTKGVPAVREGFTLADMAGAGWNLLAGDIPLPAAVVKRGALSANIAAMQEYAARHGAGLAPHGKTSMCPQLFARQIDAGAWGITVATVPQAALCDRAGVSRILIANQIAGEVEAGMFAAMAARTPERGFHVLVDSVAGAELLQRAFEGSGSHARVLIELGHDGGRTGVRSIDQGMALARAIASLDRLKLVGIEGYEGLIMSGDHAADRDGVGSYLDTVVALLGAVRDEELFAKGEPILLTAGGTAYYDLVLRHFAVTEDPRIEIILRSGCYVTHDSGFYARQLALARDRDIFGPPPALTNALEVWARVQSVPEPGLAILTVGKRDVSHDIDLPVPIGWHPGTGGGAVRPIAGWTVAKLSDQHAFLTAGADATPLHIGALIGLGVSHPCTTFDKWPLLLEVDDDYAVLGGLSTFF